MRASKTLTTMALALAVAGCDTGLGLDLTGLWVANTYEFRSGDQVAVDLIERDGASFSLTVRRFLDGTRQATALFDDGTGERTTMSGEVRTEERTFTFDSVVYDFTHEGGVLTLTSESQTFDFGDGPESATLTIRLTQL